MDQMEALQAAAASLLKKAQDATVPELASAVKKATGVLRLSSDMEKSKAEARKLALEESTIRHEIDTAAKRERSARLKDYVSLLTPIVSIVALAATVFLQTWQFTQSEKSKREAAEDARWEDAVKTISQTGKLSPGVIALNPFLKSPKYLDLARSTAIQLLANSSDQAFFNDLFGAAFVPVGWNNLDQVVKLGRALTTRGIPLWTKSYDAKTDTNDVTRLDPQEREVYRYLDSALPTITGHVAAVLKEQRPSGSSLDLSATQFNGSDWGGADLRGANIENIRLAWVDVRLANLDKITRFHGAYLYHVAWWEAKKISPELREYLEKDSTSRYNPNARYGPKRSMYTEPEYTAALDRLKQQGP